MVSNEREPKGQEGRDVRLCSICHEPIPEERLEVLPETTMCVKCARLNPPKPIDAGKLDLSEASPINQNGFAPSD